MKKVTVLMLCLAVNGCSGLEKHSEDTFWPFGGDPNAPKSESENARRVRGENVKESPLALQEGDVWPGQPDAVPTIKDVSDPNSRFSRSFQKSLKGLSEDLDRQQIANGETLAVGESVSTEKGVKRRSSTAGSGSLPSHVSDRATNYLEGPNRNNVIVPNGDGTTTVVTPDGKVHVVRGSPSVATQSRSSDESDVDPKTITNDSSSDHSEVKKSKRHYHVSSKKHHKKHHKKR